MKSLKSKQICLIICQKLKIVKKLNKLLVKKVMYLCLILNLKNKQANQIFSHKISLKMINLYFKIKMK